MCWIKNLFYNSASGTFARTIVKRNRTFTSDATKVSLKTQDSREADSPGCQLSRRIGLGVWGCTAHTCQLSAVRGTRAGPLVPYCRCTFFLIIFIRFRKNISPSQVFKFACFFSNTQAAYQYYDEKGSALVLKASLSAHLLSENLSYFFRHCCRPILRQKIMSFLKATLHTDFLSLCFISLSSYHLGSKT